MSNINKIIKSLDTSNNMSFNVDLYNSSYEKTTNKRIFYNYIKSIDSEYYYLSSCSFYNNYEPFYFNKCYNNMNGTNNLDENIKNINVINNEIDLTYKTNKPNSNVYVIENKIIDIEINSLDDLIKMINDNPICVNVSYNIDMINIHKIKHDLIELNNMIGMTSLKSHVLDQILYFTQGLHKNKNNSGDFMHTVIYGPPGTGKTEVAKILGRIYSKIGILKNQTFKKATRSDMVAGYLGQTAIKTKELIKSCIGGVLFIDEAYSLGNEEKRDSFSKECIDTLCESLSDHKDNLMVIIAGYEKELNECFFNYNQGLESRFIWRFKIDSYTGEELMKIFIKKVNDNGWSIDKDNTITPEWFEKNIQYFKSYGRDMEILFTKTKIAHSRRVFCKPNSIKTKLTIEDINKGFEFFLSNDHIKERKQNKTEKLISMYL